MFFIVLNVNNEFAQQKGLFLNKIYLLFICTILPLFSHGASFDCSKAKTKIEKAICSNKYLSNLDEELGFYFSKLRERPNKESANQILSSQRVWNKSRNKICEKERFYGNCLSKLYRERVNHLKIIYDKPFIPPVEELNNICKEITELTGKERKQYGDTKVDLRFPKKIKTIDINNDGVSEDVERCFGGTMNAPCFDFIEANRKRIEITQVYSQNNDSMTFGYQVFNKNNKWYQLHSYDDFFVRPAYISYVTPANKEYIVCEFENTKKEIFIPNLEVPSSKQVCEFVENNPILGIRNEILKDEPIMSQKELREIGRETTNLARQGFLDFDNDGASNYIGELIYASGSGRGCAYNYFDEFTDNRQSFSKSESRKLLIEMQEVNFEDRHPNCGSINKNGAFSNRFIEFNGKNYYEHHTQSKRGVHIIEDSRLHSVCNVTRDYVTTLKNVGLNDK
jgi:uncharacterized protein